MKLTSNLRISTASRRSQLGWFLELNPLKPMPAALQQASPKVHAKQYLKRALAVDANMYATTIMKEDSARNLSSIGKLKSKIDQMEDAGEFEDAGKECKLTTKFRNRKFRRIDNNHNCKEDANK